MNTAIPVKTALLWIGLWWLSDIFFMPLQIKWGWFSASAQRDALDGDFHITFFVLALWLMCWLQGKTVR